MVRYKVDVIYFDYAARVMEAELVTKDEGASLEGVWGILPLTQEGTDYIYDTFGFLCPPNSIYVWNIDMNDYFDDLIIGDDEDKRGL